MQYENSAQCRGAVDTPGLLICEKCHPDVGTAKQPKILPCGHTVCDACLGERRTHDDCMNQSHHQDDFTLMIICVHMHVSRNSETTRTICCCALTMLTILLSRWNGCAVSFADDLVHLHLLGSVRCPTCSRDHCCKDTSIFPVNYALQNIIDEQVLSCLLHSNSPEHR